MNIEESLEEVQKAIADLIEKNKTIPVIVEGKKDTKTLQQLGLKGIIIEINKGSSLTDFCDWIVINHHEIIILTDWDRRGGSLCHRMMHLLNGRIVYDTTIRERLGKHAMIKTVEGLHSWINTMNNKL
jgi:5S rRNA maturation endonuclease (ribonuclease M5)